MRTAATAALLGALTGAAAQQCTPYTWHADAWQAPPANCSTCSNIVPFFWLYASHIEANVTQAAMDAINATSQNDYASLFSWTMHRDMPKDPGDNIFKPGGGPNCSADTGRYANFSGVWWDHGAANVKELFQTFLDEYARLGGKCDRFVIDAEEWLNNWVLVNNPGPPPGCHQQRARAIASDPRFPAVEARLRAAGFYVPPEPAREADPDWLFRALNYNSTQYHIWNNVMLNQTADYFNDALWGPLRQHFAGAELSNYDYMIYNGSASECVPDKNGNEYCDAAVGARGALTGDISSPSVYMTVGSGFQRWVTARHNLSAYPATPFNAFRWGVMTVRSLVVAGQPQAGGSRVPVRPWVAPKSWDGEMVNNSAFYDEAIRHMALAGVSDFNFWNYNHNGSDVEVLSALLRELDSVAGCEQRVMAFPSCPGAPSVPCPDAVQFSRGFVLSGMEAVGAQGEARVYRLTTGAGRPADYRVHSSPGAASYVIPSADTKQPERCNVTIPEASVAASDGGPGVWVHQPMSAALPTVECA